MFQFNTAIARIMEYVNTIYKYQDTADKYYIEQLVLLIAPFAPHLAEEMWEQLGNNETIFKAIYPIYDESKTIVNEITIGVQVNGKLRGDITIGKDESEDSIKEKAFNNENVKKYLDGNEIIKTIVIPNKIVNIVIKNK